MKKLNDNEEVKMDWENGYYLVGESRAKKRYVQKRSGVMCWEPHLNQIAKIEALRWKA